jgi:hypothetical protein
MRQRQRALGVIAIALLVGACGSSTPTGAPVITPPPTPSAAPVTLAPTATAAATSSAGNPFAGQAFNLDLPDGWQSFDLDNPSGKAALDAFVAANPEMGPAIQAFKTLPNVVFASNPLLGNVVVAFSLPTGGLSLDALKESFNMQFASVPGLVNQPKPEVVTLPAGKAIHWDLKLSVNDASGGKTEVDESLYLVVSDTTAVLVEFVATGGAPVPQEDQIIRSLTIEP